MPATTRRYIEQKIAKRVVGDLLAAGFSITVNDGEEDILESSDDPFAILHAMFGAATATDDNVLVVEHRTSPRSGWVRFVWGNGEDCLPDYTTNLDPIIEPVYAWIESGFGELLGAR